jgi:plasmid segregation protein ParM
MEVRKMILAVDLGNYNIKTSEEVIFNSRFIEGDEFVPTGEEIIEYNGKYYTMMKGSFDNEFDKSKKNYLPNLLYAIGKSISSEDKEIDLVLGVPLESLLIKDKFKEVLEGKEFKFKINGKDREVTIRRFATIGEGLSTFYTFSKNDMEKDVLLIDIGGRTVNIATFINAKFEKKLTINLGMIDFYEDVKSRVNNYGKNYDVEDMERLINKEIITGVDAEADKLVLDIVNKLKPKFHIDTYDVFITGGGSLELKKSIEKLLPISDEKRLHFVSNPLFSNVLGNKKVATKKWSE